MDDQTDKTDTELTDEQKLEHDARIIANHKCSKNGQDTYTLDMIVDDACPVKTNRR